MVTYGRVLKTTVYLPDALKRRLEELARRERRSEAALIRAAVDGYVRERHRPKPRAGLFASGDPLLAERVDELLAEGFGRD
jgi:hypothetical protein